MRSIKSTMSLLSIATAGLILFSATPASAAYYDTSIYKCKTVYAIQNNYHNAYVKWDASTSNASVRSISVHYWSTTFSRVKLELISNGAIVKTWEKSSSQNGNVDFVSGWYKRTNNNYVRAYFTNGTLGGGQSVCNVDMFD